jgi:alpha-L-fucosidase
MQGIGKWLKVNGEAIYDTRPWKIFGEGPTGQAGRGGFSERQDKPFTGRDIRFTQSKDGTTLYVIVLDWPGEQLTIETVQVDASGKNGRVELLGYDGDVRYRVNDDKQLVIDMPELTPEQWPCRDAFALKLTGFETSLHPLGCFSLPGVIQVAPEKVTIEGDKAFVQTLGGRPNIGAWDNPQERLHWLVRVREPGTYAVRGEFSTAFGPSSVTLKTGSQSVSADVAKTDGWFKPVMVSLGQLDFDRAGVFRLTLEPTDAAAWKTVCVWQLQLAPAGTSLAP